jgi:hypothetical protein
VVKRRGAVGCSGARPSLAQDVRLVGVVDGAIGDGRTAGLSQS